MTPSKLPKKFYQYFWDVDPKKLNPQKKPYFVISRLLDKGNIEAARWVRKRFDDELVKEVLQKYRDFSLRSASFWALIYQVPKTQVKCLQEPYLSMRKKHWPY
jgi:hypothetical protein